MICPKCRATIPWEARLRFVGILGQRRIRPCPQCGTMIRWSKSMRVVNVAGAILLGLIVSDIVTDLLSREDPWWNLPARIVLPMLALIGSWRSRLEIVPESSSPTERTEIGSTRV
jgi:hypothetical protein